MTPQQIIQQNLEIREFLATLYSKYFEDHDGYIELRFIGKEPGAVFSKFYRPDDFTDQAFEEIRLKNMTHHVYIGVNPRPLSQAKKQDDIQNVVCLWVDVDGKDFEGGKDEAYKRIEAFLLKPTRIISSGHGFHCYWAFEVPMLLPSKEERFEFKQILSGVIKELGGDRSKVNLDACLRLPGTLNIKDSEPLECKIVENHPDKKYKLEDFARFKNSDYIESEGGDEPLPVFGHKQLIISLKDPEASIADVKRLEIDSRTKKHIITGSLLTGKAARKSRSERDISIIDRLVSNDYDYATIKSIFFNSSLGCSNRIREAGEAKLQRDVRRAIKYVEEHKHRGTPQSQKILAIKNSPITAEERRLQIADFIISDLLSGQNPAGFGLKEKDQEFFYFFDNGEKLLMNLKSVDFYCYMRVRFGISKKDFEEIKDAVMAEIWKNGQEVTPRKFAYYDDRNSILYVSNHDNQLYRLDGEKIELLDNGTDEVFFENDPALTPYAADFNLAVINYFNGNSPATSSHFKLPETPTGLDLKNFFQENCLLNKYLIDRVNFIQEEANIVSPLEQKLLLIVHFYSIFFESILQEKPIACFIGKKESGKSFIATSIGKIFFGEKYESCHFPENPDDLKTALGRNYYLVFDNVDQAFNDDVSNILCVASTGGTVAKRKLYTDSTEFRYTPHCFIAMTSREPRFNRDDLVSRLLLFNTEKIGSPIPRSVLFSSLLANRDAIMTEVLVNLNSVVKILGLNKGFEPRCISRIADWEMFGRKVCNWFPERFLFRLVMQSMNEKKDKFAIEDDYLYLILMRIVYEKNEPLIEMTPVDLYARLLEEAEYMKLNLVYFKRRYHSARSVGKRLSNIKEELMRDFDVDFCDHPNGKRTYSFNRKKDVDEDSAERKIFDELASAVTPEFADISSNPDEIEPGADIDELREAENRKKQRLADLKKNIKK